MKLPETHESNHSLEVHTVVLVVLRGHRAHNGLLVLALHAGLRRDRILVKEVVLKLVVKILIDFVQFMELVQAERLALCHDERTLLFLLLLVLLVL